MGGPIVSRATGRRNIWAAKIATLPRGANQHTAIAVSSQSQAAETLNVSVDSVQRARKVIDHGVSELVQAVERGEVADYPITPDKLLAALVRNAGMVQTHRHLLEEVWGPGHENEMQYLRVYMTQLRHKLERKPARPRYLLTEPGIGYRLRLEA